MENTNDLKIIGNLSVDTHRRVSVIKATYGLGSMEETMRFILKMFDLIDEDEKKKYMEYIEKQKLNEMENI